MTPGAIITIFTALSFLIFGVNCLVSKRMREEFKRYGLSKKRKLTGVLQILGAIGLLAGLTVSADLLLFSSSGLFLLMVLGFGLRLKLHDSFLATIPALLFAVLSLAIVLWTLGLTNFLRWMG